MRAILSDLKQLKQKQELEFELIDVPNPLEQLTVHFFEKSSLASINVPVANMDHDDQFHIRVNPASFQFNRNGQSEFAWQIYLSFINADNQYMIQVESEFLSDRHQLSLTSYVQASADSMGMAILSVHTHQSDVAFTATAVNVTEDSLQINGHSIIDGHKLSDMKVLLKNTASDSQMEYPVGKGSLKGLFTAEVPLKDIPADSEQAIFIQYTYADQPIEQRIVLAKSLAGQNTEGQVSKEQVIMIDKSFDNGLLIRSYPAPTFGEKVATLPGKASDGLQMGQEFMSKLNLFRLRRLFRRGHQPFAQTTIIFESFGGRQVSDSPYAIYNLFKELYPGFNLIWSIDRDQKKFCRDNGIQYVIRRTSKWVRTLEKAQFWISNARFPSWVRKPNYLTYIQTWHGTPLKKLGLDIENVSMPGTTTAKYHVNFVKEANRWDALVSPNDYSTRIFRSAFGYNNKILKVGYPRNDKLINSSADDITALKAELGIPADKKVVMYAPTYRDNQFAAKGKYTFELPFSLADFKKQFGEDTVLILRMHYLISNALDISDYSDFVYDFSSHPDISDLYLVSDMLITDYSSVFFDYAYLKRPILFYPYDYHLYKDELRGFYLDYERELPGKIAQDESDLLAGIQDGLQAGDMAENEKFMKFYRRFCAINDGLSSLKVVNYVVHQIEHNG
ncbi:glycosyl/glycerophosphate transferase [Secundilactobacillus oryzae JCM 18671]|uniref:Glycosyl/glycerophosphate transferase n=2 Tax=Secundilactobacillus oryzae TaxID=1202668 RepID=A0A081BJS8_9LACO|nr:CDP-glycerol glycerophosphotransferase family protein [Secundilactobacillus oryzae]GAK48296.1 glycosyl/glycerophosphate transferase [Secundilactobacillus oryzae JCM 18671]